MKWIPPKSPFNLLQEHIWQDPWKIFVCCIFCNLTRRVQAEPIFWETLNRWSTPEAMSNANKIDLKDLISPLGLSDRRSRALIRMSYDYIHLDWKADPKRLYGIGKYGSDAYRIFCAGDWKNVEPKDHALNDYHAWLMLSLS
ncbi:hypothetical protein CL622_01555 [archaeon]|nr:hypothetical protein [archaeon]